MKATLVNPGGDLTCILDANYMDHPPSFFREVMAVTGSEQVGVISRSSVGDGVTLRMMGDELSINGIVSAYIASLLLQLENGSETRVTCSTNLGVVSALASMELVGDMYRVRVRLEQLLYRLRHVRLNALRAKAVQLPGIRHLVVPLDTLPANPRSVAQEYLRANWAAGTPAAGVIFQLSLGNIISIVPYVYVKATDTLVAEQACGSGAVATALTLANKSQSHFEIAHPSGCVTTIDTSYRGSSCTTIHYSILASAQVLELPPMPSASLGKSRS